MALTKKAAIAAFYTWILLYLFANFGTTATGFASFATIIHAVWLLAAMRTFSTIIHFAITTRATR